MVALLASLLPILVVDILNPVLFAMLVLAAGSARPLVNSTMMLIGHTVAYLVAGVVVAHGLDAVTDRFANPRQIDFVIGGAVGLLLVYYFFSLKKGGAPDAQEPAFELTPVKCFGYGVVICALGVPFAVPYFGAVAQILQADVSAGASVLALGIYNLGYMLPYLAVPILVAVQGGAAKPVLEKISAVIEKAADDILPWLMLALGVALIVDATLFFMTGAGLF